MKIICISASNTKSKGRSSTSTKVCEFIKNTIQQENGENVTVEVNPLMEYDLKPCCFCGDCMKTGRCAQDGEFNRFFAKLSGADAVFFVIPHYSPIPSKLLMIFEKINEILYSGWINNPEYQSPIYNKPVGLIGHGGMVENEGTLRYYHDRLITPLAETLKSLSFKIVRYSDSFENGAVFGLKDDACIRRVEGAVFPDIIQDWVKIEKRIKPLVANVLHAAGICQSADEAHSY